MEAKGKMVGFPADTRAPGKHNMGMQRHIIVNDDIRADMTERPNLHCRCKFRLCIHNGRGMDRGHG